MRLRLSSAASSPPQPNSHLGNTLTSPVPMFPRNGITPPHPHPVAPFPPPPHSHATLQHGPVPPSPPSASLVSPPQRPFYSLTTNQLPPHLHHPQLPHTVTSSLHHHSPTSRPQFITATQTQTPATSATALPTSLHHHSPTSRPQFITAGQTPATSATALPTTRHTLPLQSPHPATVGAVGVTCNHCGHHLLVDLSVSQLSALKVPPTLPPHHTPVAGLGMVSPPHTQTQFWRHPLFRPQPAHPLHLAPPPHPHSGSAFTAPIRPATATGRVFSPPTAPPLTARVATHRGSLSTARNTRRGANTQRSRVRKVGSNGGTQEVVSQSKERIIPYRKRKKLPTVEVYAQQKLEIEFALHHKPSMVQMSELAGILGVSKDFVRQWFTNRRKKQKVSTEPSLLTIPCSTYDITVVIPPSEPQGLAQTQNSAVVFCTSPI